MFKYLNNKIRKGQSTLEFTVLVVVVIGALLAMQQYVKRSLQGRLKSSADDIGDQFSPGNTNVTKKSFTGSQTVESFAKGTTSSTLKKEEISQDVMNLDIINVDQEYWGN